jgi:hypothetical protein
MHAAESYACNAFPWSDLTLAVITGGTQPHLRSRKYSVRELRLQLQSPAATGECVEAKVRQIQIQRVPLGDYCILSPHREAGVEISIVTLCARLTGER